MTALDIAIFAAFYALVLGFSFVKSRGEKGTADYFLGGRRLPWWLIGISIVAANISSEQFVGMSGQAAGDVGLAVSGWQLTGAVGIVLVAFTFLPRFLRSGIYTMPEYLEYRYSPAARTIMAVLTVIIYVGVTTAAVLYSGATALETIFGLPLDGALVLIAAIALAYTLWGGLLAAVWADLFQGSALLIGGVVTFALGLRALGGWTAFASAAAPKLHMILPSNHPELPWTVLVGGMWIPILYYCGLNQFIVQRTLAAKSLKEGQLGVIFAAALWLLIPFAIVMPGIMAQLLYGDRLARPDQAYPTLIRELIPPGMRGLVFAAIAGAVVSTLASVLNSAATLWTMDLYRRHLRPEATDRHLVAIGRASTVLFLALACLVARSSLLAGSVFKFIQEFQGYISPGILAAFAFGMAVPRAPAAAGLAALLGSAPIYGVLQWRYGHVPYLHRMLATLGILLALMAALTAVAPLREPRTLPVREGYDMRTSPVVKLAGLAVVAAVALFFGIFR